MGKTKTPAPHAKNATKQGLWARHWQNPEEQALYDALLSDYLDDFEPVGATEYGMVETIATCRVRLLRCHTIEEANFALAQSRAIDPQRFLDSFGVDDKAVEKGFAAALYAGLQPEKHKPDVELTEELASNPIHKITGWKYVDESMPLFKAYLIEAAEQEQLSLPDLLKKITPSIDELPPLVITTHRSNEAEPKPKPDLRTQDIEAKALQKCAEHLQSLAGKHFLIMQLLVEYYSSRPNLIRAAMPTSSEMANMQRVKTAEERLMSRTLGELIEVQRLRRKRSKLA